MPQTGQLERIKVEGFKSIKAMDLELRSLNILVGANGSGKTNFIEVFKLLNEILQQNLQVYTGRVGADSFLYFGNKVTDRVQIDLTFFGQQQNLRNRYNLSLVPSRESRLIFEQEQIGFHNVSKFAQPMWTLLGGGHFETKLLNSSKILNQTDNYIQSYVTSALKEWKIYHFHDTSETAKIKQAADIDDNERLRSDASNIAAFLYLLQEQYHPYYLKIVKVIRKVAPFFDDFNLRPSPLNPTKIILEWREKGSDLYFDAHTLSDGTLRFICLSVLLLQPELPSVILIDEPELGLHPYAITVLADLLHAAAERTQVIVSTQSVPLVNQFSPQDLIIVDRKGGQSEFERMQENALDNWMDEYGLGELWEKNKIGGRPQRWEAI